MSELGGNFPRNRITKDASRGGRVKQSFREESDINVIMARWRKTGILPTGKAEAPMYGDFTNSTDFQTAKNMVMEAEASFKALPAKIRSRFGHDPKQLIEFMADPANLEEGRELGVIAPAPPPVVESPPIEPPAEGGSE